MPVSAPPLDWVDTFIARIRPFVYVRSSDNVLIRMPNEVFKLNAGGIKLMQHLLQGGSVQDILKARRDDPAVCEHLAAFFNDLSLLLGAGFCDSYRSPALERVEFKLGYIDLPILSELAVTWRCNIRCRFCYAACKHVEDSGSRMSSEEMTGDECKRVIRTIKHEAQTPSISFTGGEPLVRKDLVELIDFAAHEMNMRVNLITNGTLIDDRTAAALRKAGLASAQVSIESPRAEVHDAMVGIKGAFEASVAGLQALKRQGILVHPHSTMCAMNRESLPGMAAFATSLGSDRFSMNLIIPTGRGIDSELMIAYHEVGEILHEIMAAAEAHKVRFMWYSPTPVCLFNPIPYRLGNKGCSACEGLLSVDPQGNLLPCSSWNEPVGNLLTESFEALWRSPRAQWLREKRAALDGCRECSRFALCQGACPLYFQVYGYGEIEPFVQRLTERSA